MTSSRFTVWLLGATAVAVAQVCRASTYTPVNDNHTAPYLGMVQGGPVGVETDQFATWLNRTTIYGEGTYSFGSGSDWNSLAQYQSWFYAPAKTFIQEGNGRALVICVPILVGPTNDSGPTTGPGAGTPVSFASGATGAYNNYFYAMGQQLVANGLANAVLRLGWEFNGNWYAWSVATPTDAANFVAYWKQIVNTLRTVPGQSFKFNWGGTITYVGSSPAYSLAQAFPAGNDAAGRPYVDQVGVDVYDSSWTYYPWAAGSTATQIQTARQNTWNYVINTSNQYWGIPSWAAIASSNHIPLTIPEWGVSTDIHAGGDNTYYIQQMYNFIQNPANNVLWASYYDNEESKISPTDGFVTTLTSSAALYRQLWTIVAAAPAGLTSTGGDRQVVLNWQASTGAASYTVLRATTSGGPYTAVASNVLALTYTDTSVTNLVPYYYVVEAVNLGGASANSTSASVIPAVPPASFASWQAAVFTTQQLSNLSVSGWQACPAGDGVINLMKYALGLPPMTPSVVDLSTHPPGSHLVLTYRCLTNPTDLHYVPQVSSDLTNWSAVTPVITVPDDGSGRETAVATDPVAQSAGARRFMRLLVTSP